MDRLDNLINAAEKQRLDRLNASIQHAALDAAATVGNTIAEQDESGTLQGIKTTESAVKKINDILR